MELLLKDIFVEDADFYTKHCLEPMYDYDHLVRNLGFPPQGITTYWSSNCVAADAVIVSEYLKEKRLDAYNQRVFKRIENDQTSYEIRFASQQLSSDPDATSEKLLNLDEVRNGIQFRMRRGDYSSVSKYHTADAQLSIQSDRNSKSGDSALRFQILDHVIEDLEQAEQEVANENQRKMLREYVTSFKTGSIDAHKQGSRHWVQDKGPAVETYVQKSFHLFESYVVLGTQSIPIWGRESSGMHIVNHSETNWIHRYIGFIENYRDPAGSRAEFEGFVAVVNREGSKKLGILVDAAEAIIQKSMPWPREFEKDAYLRPDFTALDVITCSSSLVPSGINIPNCK